MNDNKILKQIFSFIVFLIGISPVFVLSIFGFDLKTFLILSIILAGLTIYCFILNKELFPSILFFTIVHVLRPVNFKFTKIIGLNFPGTFFLIPIIIFTILILVFPQIRKNINWWTKDTIDKKTIIIIIGLSLISGIFLYIWAKWIAYDLSKYTKNLPNVSWIWIIIYGVVFALFNSIAEEYLSRGMLCNGLEKILRNKIAIIIIQAVIFGVFHYHGFPGGMIGMIMVFVWSVVLGVIRYRTNGLIGVLIGHFFADFTIYFILYALK